MRAYYTGGTVGDTYVTLCKLYSVAKREEILCRHHTKHKQVEQIVREIYSLLPKIYVEFLEDELSEVQVHGVFWHQDQRLEWEKYKLKPEFYPEFELESVEHFELPGAYMVLQTISGIRQNRKLPIGIIDEILANTNLPIVLIGDADERVIRKDDVCGATSIKQIINIIRNSKHFYGPQGFLTFVAVSQKVPSTVYITSDGDDIAVQRRIEATEKWKRFLVEKIRI